MSDRYYSENCELRTSYPKLIEFQIGRQLPHRFLQAEVAWPSLPGQAFRSMQLADGQRASIKEPRGLMPGVSLVQDTEFQ